MANTLEQVRAQARGRSIDGEFRQLFTIMSTRSFRHGTSTGGEQPYYIYDYPPAEELDVRQHIENLIRDLQQITPADADDYAPRILHLDLYADVALPILEQRHVLDRLLEREDNMHGTVAANPQTDRFLNVLIGALTGDGDVTARFIADRVNEARAAHEADIVFLTGIGAVYPYMRAHLLLENLQGYVDDCPLVLFYPGTYTQGSASGSSLKLFDALENNNYYRARRLLNMPVAD